MTFWNHGSNVLPTKDTLPYLIVNQFHWAQRPKHRSRQAKTLGCHKLVKIRVIELWKWQRYLQAFWQPQDSVLFFPNILKYSFVTEVHNHFKLMDTFENSYVLLLEEQACPGTEWLFWKVSVDILALAGLLTYKIAKDQETYYL